MKDTRKKKDDKNKTTFLGGQSKGFGTKKMCFSSSETMDSWLGGKGEQLIWELKLGKYRVSIWKDL